jgi:hypothetical protein
MKHQNIFISKGKKNCSYFKIASNTIMHNTNIVTLKPSGATIVSTLVANISPIIDITEEGNDHNVLDLVS